jgi:hypothetical protein
MGQPAKQVFVFPSRLGDQPWRGLVEGETFYYEMPVSMSGEFAMRDAKIAYKPASTPEMDAARRTRTFRVFGHFNQVPLWQISPVKDALQVEMVDLRFGPATRPAFIASALIGPDGQVQDERFRFGR